jgi:hypothetical protein
MGPMTRLATMFALAVSLAGCASHQPAACSYPGVDSLEPTKAAFNANADTPRALSIELLGFQECPNTPTMRANLRAALETVGKEVTFSEVDQDALPASDIRRGWPTPTVLVNGQDLFGMPPPSVPSMGCRVYPNGVPDSATVAERLCEIAGMPPRSGAPCP